MNIISYLGRGIVHERSGIPCQDALGYRYADNGNVIAALSDGAGSARYAAEASQETVSAVLDYFSQVPLSDYEAMDIQDRRKAVLEACRSRLLRLWQQIGEPDLRHLSSTLLFAVITREQMLLGHLGDGIIVVLDSNGNPVLFSQPEQYPGRNRTTYFVVSPQAQRHLRLHFIDRGQSSADFLVMTSDGPYEMFCNRWSSDPVATVQELQRYVRDQGLNSDNDLAEVLNQMAEVTIERMDDWSVLAWSALSCRTAPNGPAEARSMLQEEEQKYSAGQTERTVTIDE